MIVKYTSAAMLPDEWDRLTGDNVYMKREFLSFMENAEDSIKEYYAVYNDTGALDTIFVACKRKHYNLAMFTKLKLSLRATLIYLPVSVARPGIIFGKCRDEAMTAIRAIRGWKVILNLTDSSEPGYASGLTCPQCILDLRWKSFDEYMEALRSGYRYRYRKALQRSEGKRIRFLPDNRSFTDELYRMYLSVYNNSRIRVEKLNIDFFRDNRFKIFVLEDDSRKYGFVQLLENGDELVFEFVGIDYRYQQENDTYLRMLLEIIRYGIENGFKTIDFGQTADDTKLKLGCRYVYLYAAVHNSNPILHAICRRVAPSISYKPITEQFHVFKDQFQK